MTNSFEFSNKFDFIHGDRIDLRIREQNPGNDVLIPFYYYDIILKPNNEVIGKISIRIGHNYHSKYNGNIGYEIDEPSRGHGYALEAMKMVLTIAKYHNMSYLYLTCTHNNFPSVVTIEKAGGVLVEEVVPPSDYFAYRPNIPLQRIYKLNLE